MYFYLNGKFLKHNKVIDINDRGFLLGDGVFTTIKIHNGRPCFIEEHLTRLQCHANSINITIPVDQIKNEAYNLLKLNNLTYSLASMRITITRGTATSINIPTNITPTILITTRTATIIKQSVSICKTSIIRSQSSLLTRIKSLNYLELILNRQEANMKGFDDGYMCNNAGAITECSVSNIFFVTKKNHIVTPHKSDGLLEGVSRKKVIEGCKDLNLIVEERSIYPDELTNFISAFITNSLIGVQKIHQLEQYTLNLQNSYIDKIISHYNLLTMGNSDVELS